MNKTRVWIDPLFKKKLQKMAIEEEMSLLEFTRLQANKEGFFMKVGNNEKKKKYRFSI